MINNLFFVVVVKIEFRVKVCLTLSQLFVGVVLTQNLVSTLTFRPQPKTTIEN